MWTPTRKSLSQEVKEPRCHQRVEVQPKLYKIFHLGPECLSPEGGRLLPPHFPLGWMATAVEERPQRSATRGGGTGRH